MVEWDTVGVISLILPVDALLVSYLTYYWLSRKLKKIWREEQKNKKHWWQR